MASRVSSGRFPPALNRTTGPSRPACAGAQGPGRTVSGGDAAGQEKHGRRHALRAAPKTMRGGIGQHGT